MTSWKAVANIAAQAPQLRSTTKMMISKPLRGVASPRAWTNLPGRSISSWAFSGAWNCFHSCSGNEVLLQRPKHPTTPRRWHNSHSHSHHSHGHGGSGGSSGDQSSTPTVPPGPRAHGCALGLDVAKATQNILRLLEASHGPYASAAGATSAESMVWHAQGLQWQFDSNDMQWKATTSPTASSSWTTLLSLTMSDDRTALVKLLDTQTTGQVRYVSLLRLEEATPAHDGWRIVREAVATSNGSSSDPFDGKNDNAMQQISQTLQKYLEIEHGGGAEDATFADQHLLAPQFSLLTVGTAPADEAPSAWSSPAGTFLEISRDTYLEGVASQSPHAPAAAAHDAILSIDVATGSSYSNLATAVVRVGNGAQSATFVDHLMLGKKDGGDENWQILSKVFSSQAWPSAK